MRPPVPSASGLRYLCWLTSASLLAAIVAAAGISTLELLDTPRQLGVRVSLGVAIAAVCGTSSWLLYVNIYEATPGRATFWPTLLGSVGAGAILVLTRAYPPGGFPWPLLPGLFLGALCVGLARHRLLAALAGAAVGLLCPLLGTWLDGEVAERASIGDATVVVLFATATWMQVRLWQVVTQLDRDRRVDRDEAVSGERLRFAAELHDIQGHSLQVIALKSELAGRLAFADPARAAAEMREVEALAREALGDTRAVVRGYREVSLEQEIGNARRVLDAAGIDCEIVRAPDLPRLSGADERLLGLIVREGTTNVIRHSQANRAEIALTAGADGTHLRFVNDAPLAAPADGQGGPGGGLAGLATRFEGAGGSLAWHRAPDGFTVDAFLPAVARVR